MVGYKISNWSRATALVTADGMDQYRPCVREGFARGAVVGMISTTWGGKKETPTSSLYAF